MEETSQPTLAEIRPTEDERAAWAAETERRVEAARADERRTALGMSRAELSAREEQARREALDRRERDIAQRELRAEATALLREHGLPESLIGATCLSADREAMAQSVAAAEAAFRQAVQTGVEERLRGTVPKACVHPADAEEMSDEAYYRGVFGR